MEDTYTYSLQSRFICDQSIHNKSINKIYIAERYSSISSGNRISDHTVSQSLSLAQRSIGDDDKQATHQFIQLSLVVTTGRQVGRSFKINSSSCLPLLRLPSCPYVFGPIHARAHSSSQSPALSSPPKPAQARPSLLEPASIRSSPSQAA